MTDDSIELIERIKKEAAAKEEALRNDPEAYRLEMQRRDAEYQAQQAFQRGGLERDQAYGLYGLKPDGSWIVPPRKRK